MRPEPKGLQLEVRARRAPRLLVLNIVNAKICKHQILEIQIIVNARYGEYKIQKIPNIVSARYSKYKILPVGKYGGC